MTSQQMNFNLNLLILFLFFKSFANMPPQKSSYVRNINTSTIFYDNINDHNISLVNSIADITGLSYENVFYILKAFLRLFNLPNVDQVNDILYLHNYYREQVLPYSKQMSILKWNDSLAISSQDWVLQCKWRHYVETDVGQNMYAMSANNNDWSSVIHGWGSDHFEFNYTDIKYNAYTQMIWDNVKTVGCSSNFCESIEGLNWPNSGTLYVCNYYPNGNWLKLKPYQETNLNDSVIRHNIPNINLTMIVVNKNNNIYAIDNNTYTYEMTNNKLTRIVGRLKSISLSEDGCLYAIGINHSIWKYQNQHWSYIAYGYTDVAALNCNDALTLGSDNYIRQLTGLKVIEIPDKAKKIQGTFEDVWILLHNNTLIRKRHNKEWNLIINEVKTFRVYDLTNVCIVSNDGNVGMLKQNNMLWIGKNGTECAIANSNLKYLDDSNNMWSIDR